MLVKLIEVSLGDLTYKGQDLNSYLDFRGSAGTAYTYVGATSAANSYEFSDSKLYLNYLGSRYEVSNAPDGYVAILPALLESDCKGSIQAIHSAGLSVDLAGLTVPVSTGGEYPGSIRNGVIIPFNLTTQAGSFLTFRGNDITIKDVHVDMQDTKARRVVHIAQGSTHTSIINLEVSRVKDSVFTSGLFMDCSQVYDCLVDGYKFHNLTAVPNGQQADADGTCRGLIVGSALEPAPTQATVSTVQIKNVQGWDTGPFEDNDAVVVQVYDANGVMLDAPGITVSTVHTHNVRKRAVKIQANKVVVKDVYAYCDTSDSAMYAVVSLYGTGCIASNIQGVGRILNGADSAYGSNSITNLDLRAVRTGADTLAGIGAGLLINSGEMRCSNLHSEGTEYVLAVRDALGDTPYVNVNGLTGQGYSGAVRFQVRAGFSIGAVHLSDIAVTSSATNKAAFSVDFVGNGMRLLTVSDVKYISSAGTFAEFNLSGAVQEAVFNNCTLNAGTGSIGIAMNTGKCTCIGIRSNKVYAVDLQNTTGSYVASVDGAVRIRDTTDTTLITAASFTGTGNTNLRQANYSVSNV